MGRSRAPSTVTWSSYSTSPEKTYTKGEKNAWSKYLGGCYKVHKGKEKAEIAKEASAAWAKLEKGQSTTLDFSGVDA